MKQQNPEKLLRSQEVLKELKEARGGSLLNSHQVMGNDPNLANAFLQQYLNCNKRDVEIPRKYRELIVMAIGMATGTSTTTKVHAGLALENGATVDDVFEAILVLDGIHHHESQWTDRLILVDISFRTSIWNT